MILALVGCGEPGHLTLTAAHDTATSADPGAAGRWAGPCVADGTGTPLTLDAELDLTDDAGALVGTFQYGVEGSTTIDVQRFRVAGDRSGADVALHLVGNTTTTGTATTDLALEFALVVGEGQLDGSLVVEDEDEGILMALTCAWTRPAR